MSSLDARSARKSHVGQPVKIIDKFIDDLELLSKSIIDIFERKNSTDNGEAASAIRDDCYELQKFCAKLEYLLQYQLKEKKNASTLIGISASSALSSTADASGTQKREYWSLLLDVFKTSHSFEDAIKYVLNLNDVKTNFGRSRAFVRFCFQYHRLADAVQQLTMDQKLLNKWYSEKSVWFDETHKGKIIQLLYDLNDVNFDLIGKNNFELDSNWPTIQLMNLNNNEKYKNRTNSLSIHALSDRDQNDYQASLLGSTPLEMDNDFLYGYMNSKKSHADDCNSEYMKEIDLNDTRYSLSKHADARSINRHMDRIDLNDDNLSLNSSRFKGHLHHHDEMAPDSTVVADLLDKLKDLKDKLDQKTEQNNNLNDSIIKQTVLCDDITKLFKRSEEKNQEFELKIKELTSKNEHLLSESESSKKQLENTKLQLNAAKIQNENLQKENSCHLESINDLKRICQEKEDFIKSLNQQLTLLKNDSENRPDDDSKKDASEYNSDEKQLLENRIKELTETLNEQVEKNLRLTQELDDIKSDFKSINDKNSELISQLEMDNNEIKKRLVKLIKEKAELWQKADNLEYENLIKTTNMWIDDANVKNCMNCNSAFTFLLRKHHCRICLKIYCYYCCNNWIEYNNNKIRTCKKCHDSKEYLHMLKYESLQAENASTSSAAAAVANSNTEETVDEGPQKDCPATKPAIEIHSADDDEEEEANPNINFEVRAERLNTSYQSIESDPDKHDLQHKPDHFNSKCEKADDLNNPFYMAEGAADERDAFTIVSQDDIHQTFT